MQAVCILVQNIYDCDSRVRRKAEALVAAGYSVDVLALAADHGKKTYTLNGVRVRTVALKKKRASLGRYIYEYAAFFVWSFVQLFFLMRQKRYVVIDVNTLPDFLIFAALPGRWMGAKLILDMHEITPEFYMSKYGVGTDSWLIHLLKYVERISFNFANYVVTISEPVQDLLVGRGLDPSKSIVVMNSADEARFAPSTSSSDTKAISDGFKMIYHGTLTRFYGLQTAIEAFNIAHQEMPAAELWILGSGTEKDTLEELALKFGLDSKIKIVGQVPPAEIPNWLSKCHVGVLPIQHNVFLDFAFPNKLPEFIIMGKPVLASRLKTIRRYFTEEALSYFEPDSPEDLARQMIRLYRDRELRAGLAERAKEEYALIRWDVMKRRYLKLINEATGSKHSAFESQRVTEIIN